MIKATKRLIEDRSGAAMVEFMFAIPILLIIFAGIVELGSIMHYYQALSDGSRAAARYLSRVEDPCDPAELDHAASLAATRSSDWSAPPALRDWPSSSAGVGATFQISVPECSGGALSGDVITFITSYQYRDAFGALALFGDAEGFWLTGLHQEVHLGA